MYWLLALMSVSLLGVVALGFYFEIPPLDAPESYRPPVEALVTRVLGPSALEERT